MPQPIDTAGRLLLCHCSGCLLWMHKASIHTRTQIHKAFPGCLLGASCTDFCIVRATGDSWINLPLNEKRGSCGIEACANNCHTNVLAGHMHIHVCSYVLMSPVGAKNYDFLVLSFPCSSSFRLQTSLCLLHCFTLGVAVYVSNRFCLAFNCCFCYVVFIISVVIVFAHFRPTLTHVPIVVYYFFFNFFSSYLLFLLPVSPASNPPVNSAKIPFFYDSDFPDFFLLICFGMR